jgi:hypothetical protein
MTSLRFDAADLDNTLPPPGFYRSRITTARYRKSSSGNRMLQVVHALDGAPPGHDRVADYFVLEGTSAYALAMARRRIVDLYRACGLEPQKGDEIAAADLFDAVLEVKIEHDEWEGRPRLRVVAFRCLGARNDADIPF